MAKRTKVSSNGGAASVPIAPATKALDHSTTKTGSMTLSRRAVVGVMGATTSAATPCPSPARGAPMNRTRNLSMRLFCGA
jgi:hypothetical protein